MNATFVAWIATLQQNVAGNATFARINKSTIRFNRPLKSSAQLKHLL
jgi:hypothetical protein